MKSIGKKAYIQKVRTNVPGLDKLLYGGLNLVPENSVLIVKSSETGQGTTFGLQLLFGLTQTMKRRSISVKARYISNHDDEACLNNELLDTVIASAIQSMIRKYVSSPKPKDSLLNMKCRFARTFFDIIPNNHEEYTNADEECLSAKSDDIDIRICEEAIYYSNRTHSLHERTLRSLREGLADSDATNLLYHRRSDSYSELQESSSLKADLDFPLEPLDITYSETPNPVPSEWKEYPETPRGKVQGRQTGSQDSFIVFDLAGPGMNEDCVKTLIRQCRHSSRLLIIILPLNCSIPTEETDMVIELMTSDTQKDSLDAYTMSYLHITQSRNQMTALGKHFYKCRDYGIEVFPSLHTYFQKRRYLQRALVNTHSSIVSDTYQQYLDKAPKQPAVSDNFDFDNYMQTRRQTETSYIDALFTNYDIGYSSVDVLENILIPTRTSKHILDYQGSVTAIIGDCNNYKRFITFGSIFSSSLDKDHTLIILLNKDADTIRRRLSCPARNKRGKNCQECHCCYHYIHFMDICMGNISADEFIYYIERQFETPFDDGKSIRRVVIDDLQIVDFCFPFLKGSTLFLSALVAICRERGIELYILCDKTAGKVSELRAVADNIICTGRDNRGNLQLYIERFIGFNNTPSKIYCGTVKKVKDLFQCFYRVDESGEKRTYLKLNSLQIEDDKVSSMKDYWE